MLKPLVRRVLEDAPLHLVTSEELAGVAGMRDPAEPKSNSLTQILQEAIHYMPAAF